MHSVNQDRCDAGLVRCVYKNAICKGHERPCVYGPVNVDRCAGRVERLVLLPHRRGLSWCGTTTGRCCRSRCELFGFGADTGIDLPFEFDGTVPDKELKQRVRRARRHQRGRGPRTTSPATTSSWPSDRACCRPPRCSSRSATRPSPTTGFVLKPEIIRRSAQPGVPDGDAGRTPTCRRHGRRSERRRRSDPAGPDAAGDPRRRSSTA